MRFLSYKNTDVFLVCFSVVSPNSFRNVMKMWIEEIRQASRHTPIVLVGTKTDLRHDKTEIEHLAKSKLRPITQEQGEKAAKDCGATAYIECSALTQSNLKETFDTAIIAALRPSTPKRIKYLCCS